MGDELRRIEFLESPEGPGESADVAWLDIDGEQEENLGGSRGGSLLPPRTTVRRVLVSLLVFALALSTTGWAGVDAFRHDQAVQAAENELVLREAAVIDPMTLTDPGELGELGSWRVEPSASIAVSVTNESPDPITLLPGATLLGPGLADPATLRPSGTKPLRPGQSGELTGVATVDCGILTERPTDVLGNDSILAQARTTSGAVGVATIALGGAESIRSAICTEEGEPLAASFVPRSVNVAQRTFTVAVSAHSLSAQALPYQVTASYVSSAVSIGGLLTEGLETTAGGVSVGEPTLPGSLGANDLPGLKLSSLIPTGRIAGTLAAGASLNAEFTVHVLSCPSAVPTSQYAVELGVMLEQGGLPVDYQADGFDLATLVGAACGLLA